MTDFLHGLESATDVLLDIAVQGLLVLAAAWAASRVVARRQPAASHAITVAACVGLLILPLFHPWSGRLGLFVRSAAGVEAPAPSFRSGSVVSGAAAARPGPVLADGPRPTPVTAPAPAIADAGLRKSRSASTPAPDGSPGLGPKSLVFFAWGLGVLVVLALWCRDTWALSRLLARCSPAGPELEGLLDQLVRRTRARRRPRLLVSDEIDAPAMAGQRHPCVLLPRGLAEGLDRRLLAPLILHELAHLERGDVFVDRLSRLVCALHWFQPLAWSARRRLARQREILTDARVVEIERRRSDYAEGLLDVLRRRPAPTSGIGLGGGPARSIAERLEILLHGKVRAGTSGPARSAIVLSLAVGLAGASRLGFASEGATITASFTDDGAPMLVVQETRDVAQALAEARDWLLRNQAEDGSWSDGEVAGAEAMVPGWTALGVLALMVGPRPQPDSAARRALDRGVTRLLSFQGPRGDFASKSSSGRAYAHCLGLLALARYESLGLEASIEVKPAMAKAQAGLLDAQNPYAGWRYGPRDGDNDASLTGWGLLALDAGRRAGVAVDPMRMDWALRFIDSMTDEKSGRTGYVRKGGATLRNLEVADSFPSEESESLTAMAILLRARCRQADDSARRDRALSLLAGHPPLWDISRGSIDYFYWLLGSQAVRTLAAQDERRVAWETALSRALLEGQVQEGSDRGAWPARDPWAAAGGRIYSTTFAMLALAPESL